MKRICRREPNHFGLISNDQNTFNHPTRGEHMKHLLTAILALTLSYAAVGQSNSTPTDVEQAITHLREGLLDSFNQGDIDRLLTYFDTNAVVTLQDGEVCEGTNAIKAYYERMMKGDHPVASKITAEPKVLGQHLQGDWAISWGDLNDNFVLSDGRQLPLNSHFTATIAKRGDKWLVSSFHASVNAFENPITALAVKKISLIGGIGGIVVGVIVGVVAAGFFRRPNRTA
jgi:ketosteroid isomerase-like protein